MKFFILYIILSFYTFSTSALEEVRTQFPNIDNLEQAENFIVLLENETSPEAKGYIAVMNFMKSRYVSFPFTKLKYFKEGKNELDAVIKNNPNNVEVRYLRFLMQKEIPDFLGYNKNINEDFTIIVNKIEGSSLNLKQKAKMLQCMLETKELTSIQKQQLNQLINTQ